MTAINATLQDMIDHHEIRKMLSVYCHGCDRGDSPRMGSVYAQESWDDHGVYKGSGSGFAELSGQQAATGRKLHHMLGQTLINVTGDAAGAETYFLATITRYDTGRELITLLGGRYVDALVREDGQWKVKDRVCVHDWSRTLDTMVDPFAGVDFVRGKISDEDPSYAALGLKHPGLPVA
jgi:hypothetical protein